MIGVAAMVAASLGEPNSAYAGTGKKILETMSVSVAVGSVLGAATLPFYDQPGKHIGNVFLGAGVGALVGGGLLGWGALRGKADDMVDRQYNGEKLPKWAERAPRPSPSLQSRDLILTYSPLVSVNW